MEEALFLTRFGRRVTVIHRRDRLRASKIMAERARAHEKVDFIWNTVVEEVLGETHITGLRLRTSLTAATSEFEADALFIAIGHTPNTRFSRASWISTSSATSPRPTGLDQSDGVFVAGDVNDFRYRQAVTAAGAGCRAAMDAEKYLEALEFKVDSLARL